MFADLWYRNSVFYNLDLETFQDSNGDGVGDFEGLSRRLDYLESLGINALWLGPFQPTPNRDNGYDISDYYGVDPRHGSSGDFVEFLNDARSRGIRVVIDLVVNHTSDRHPWFREARRSTSSQFHDWYVWSKKRPPNWKFCQGSRVAVHVCCSVAQRQCGRHPPTSRRTSWPGHARPPGSSIATRTTYAIVTPRCRSAAAFP
jgi:hypothetical protein